MTADSAKPEICGKETELRVLEGESDLASLVSRLLPQEKHVSIESWNEPLINHITQERRKSSTGRKYWRVGKIEKLGDRGREVEDLEAQGVVATREERGDKSGQLLRMEEMEEERVEHLHQLPSNLKQKTKKTKINLCSPPTYTFSC